MAVGIQPRLRGNPGRYPRNPPIGSGRSPRQSLGELVGAVEVVALAEQSPVPAGDRPGRWSHRRLGWEMRAHPGRGTMNGVDRGLLAGAPLKPPGRLIVWSRSADHQARERSWIAAALGYGEFFLNTAVAFALGVGGVILLGTVVYDFARSLGQGPFVGRVLSLLSGLLLVFI